MAIDKSSFPAIRADISIGHHPDTVASKWAMMDEDGTVAQQALNAGIAAAKAVYTGQAEALDARKAVAKFADGKPVATPRGVVIRHGMEREYAEGVNRIKDKALKSFDAYHLQVTRTYDHLYGKLKNCLKDTTTSRELQQEIRAFVRSMDDKKRLPWLMAQPLQTIAAVMAAPTYLSGLDDNQLEIIRTNAVKRFMPVESAQLDHVDGVCAHLFKMRQEFVKWADDEIAEANTPAARAFAKMKALGK
jgi:hypothetical protein